MTMKSNDCSAITIIQLVGQLRDAQDVDWRSWKIKHIPDVVSKHISRVVLPFPSNLANARCLTNLPTNCCNIVVLQRMNSANEHILTITDVNIHAVIANN